MKIAAIDDEVVAALSCVVPEARGRGVREAVITTLFGRVDALPGRLQGLVLTSDLQARERGGAGRAIGVALAEQLVGVCRGRGLAPSRVGVVLAGDLYTAATLERRFGVGDVSDVWDAFAARFAWVTGVLGNVDRLPPAARKRHRLLEGDAITLDGLRIAGVGGIIGDARMENRRPQEVVEREFASALRGAPDLLVLHEGPSVPGVGLPGSDVVRRALRDFTGVVVCGHCTWPRPLAAVRGATVINTDGRCVVLTA
ncbi:MAG: hypothetical protein R3A51_08655 [Nannocystaceae bacterium]